MLRFARRQDRDTGSLLRSELYNERTFYRAFLQDIAGYKNELLVECPFMTARRVSVLLPAMQVAVGRGVRVTVNTRQPMEHDEFMRAEAAAGIDRLLQIRVDVLFTGGHHRKISVIDRKILYEGSLNILSQGDSCEVMRRTESEDLARQMMRFMNIERYL